MSVPIGSPELDLLLAFTSTGEKFKNISKRPTANRANERQVKAIRAHSRESRLVSTWILGREKIFVGD